MVEDGDIAGAARATDQVFDQSLQLVAQWTTRLAV
jgi:hypothetical protein